ncbi:hypothetical protein GQ600_10883 [Phytophthora cactorum]|nr:hypothetical protein GQ600_10883 [Phytophthora cactorum]
MLAVCVEAEHGHEPRGVSEPGEENQMDDLHLEIMKLRDRVSAIQRNQDYAKVRWPICNCVCCSSTPTGDDFCSVLEKSMSLQSSIEGNNHRATWVSVLQIAILLVTGFYQAKHLQTTFIKRNWCKAADSSMAPDLTSFECDLNAVGSWPIELSVVYASKLAALILQHTNIT